MSTAAHDRASSANEAAAEVGRLFARHSRMVYGICRAMLRDVQEAEDATQQAFLSAHKALLGGAEVRDPGGWLATIARNECRARIAAGMRRPLPVAHDDLDAIPDAGDELARHAQREELSSALAELPERQREAVVLRYLYGLRYGEVATALGLSRPATEALLFRARRTMRTSLRPVAGVAIAVPVAVREQLALALPGFEERAAPAVLGAGVASGVLAKLAAGGAGVKVATATVAVATVGAVGTVGPDRPTTPRADAALVQPVAEGRSGSGGDDGESDRGREADDRSGSGSGDDTPERDDEDGASGKGSDDRGDDGSGSGGERHDDESSDDRSGPSDDGRGTTDVRETTETDGSSGSGSSGSDSSGKGGSGSSGSGSNSGSGSGDIERDVTELDENDPSGSGSGDDEEPSGED